MRSERILPARASDRLHPDDRLVDIGEADALVLDLGRVGAGDGVKHARCHGSRRRASRARSPRWTARPPGHAPTQGHTAALPGESLDVLEPIEHRNDPV